MKKLVVLLVAFMVLACGAFAVTAAFAEEITEPPVTETPDTTPGTEGEDPVTPPEDQTTDAEEESLKDKLNALLEKLGGQKPSQPSRNFVFCAPRHRFVHPRIAVGGQA